MNERMAELFGQAGISDSISEEFGIEYLAELIVKECASAVNSRDDSDTGFWANIIKEHFGVEK